MKYTRKPQQSREVTFSLSWIEEPVTVPAVSSMPFELLVKLTRDDDPEPLLNALPEEISILFAVASGTEVSEFMTAWGDASEQDEKEASRTNTLFDRIIRGFS